MKKVSETYARFPTKGKLIDFFIKNLEIQYTNDADKKRYQRFVNEENITIDEYNEVFEYCIDNILDELLIDDKLKTSAKKAIDNFLLKYMENITEIEVFPYTQESINYVLRTSIFLPFLIFFNQYYVKVDVKIFSDSKETPLKTIFNLLNHENLSDFLFHELDILTDKEKTDKTLHQNIENWLTKNIYPNREYRKHLSTIFSKALSQDIEYVEQLFMVGKLLSKIQPLQIEELDLNISFFTSKELEQKIENSCTPQLNKVAHLLFELYSLSDIKSKKTIAMLETFENLYKRLKSHGYTAENNPYMALAKARLYAHKQSLKNLSNIIY